ncbi:hypothetical protein LCGC14_0973400, partial [marine sediment metagenome]
SWTKHIYSIEEIDVKIEDIKIDQKKKDFIWNMFSRQPCFVCPFRGRCNETNLDNFNPTVCRWLTNWILVSIRGEKYEINFAEEVDKSGNLIKK